MSDACRHLKPLRRREWGEKVPQRDDVEKHFNCSRALDERFKQALAESEFRTQSEFFRFQMMQFVHNFESKKKRRVSERKPVWKQRTQQAGSEAP